MSYHKRIKVVTPAVIKSPVENLKSRLSNKYPSVTVSYPYFIPGIEEDDIFIYSGYTQHNNTNILSLDSSYLAKFLRSKYKPGKKIIFDNSLEGGIDDIIDRIYEVMELVLEIPSTSFYYITGAINAVEGYDAFCRRNNIPETNRINVAGVSYWERYMFNSIQYNKYNPEIKIKNKLFLCFNRVVRAHRTMLVSEFFKNNLIDRSYVSYFPSFIHYKTDMSLDLVLSSVEYHLVHVYNEPELYNEVKKNILDNQCGFPLKLNIEPTTNKTWIDDQDVPLYENSYLSVVTETSFFDRIFEPASGTRSVFDWYSVFFTEKIFKPICMKHPFIVLARPNFLLHLRKRGYKTFAPYINEDYDIIHDDVKRFKAVMTEIIRLSKFTDAEWIEWQEGVQNIVDHNYMVINTNRDPVTEKNF